MAESETGDTVTVPLSPRELRKMAQSLVHGRPGLTKDQKVESMRRAASYLTMAADAIESGAEFVDVTMALPPVSLAEPSKSDGTDPQDSGNPDD